jgi:hypothetical protein
MVLNLRTFKRRSSLRKKASSMGSPPLHSTIKWCGGENEQDADQHGENNPWRIQDARAVLVESREHGLPHHKLALSSSPPKENNI